MNMGTNWKLGYKLPNSSWAYVEAVAHPNGDGYLFDVDTGKQMSVNGRSVFSCRSEAWLAANAALRSTR
jgi:hypothetical protein